ncbi:putative sulfate exporter family transporter [Actinobacteria bacterium YIM 96077]|uniref:Putative sulfate exporter family transporter n=2 Tax=Phytoactinopolyspora halophila TaxID=1981511 RepID=A0A329QFK4_9ACTN|nr:putative sulfate exporter family transporter [Actinobacteria bacterium YIM 96077]RAW10741.1 putative sulfate exporter family transporter [Phytoactinopolyspora halophila]
MLGRCRTLLPGLAVVAAGVGAAVVVSRVIPVSVLLVALVLGVIAANAGLIGPVLRPGLSFAARQLLRAGVVLLGLQLAVPEVLSLGPGVLAVVAVSVAVTFAGTVVAGRALGLSPQRSILIATGFSICGASAVAAAGSVVDSDDEDVATAIALVTIFGTASLVVMPVLYAPLGMPADTFGIWVGASVHEVAQVVAAAGAVGSAALAPAVVVKLTRVVLLAPVIAGLSVWQRRQERHGPGADADWAGTDLAYADRASAGPAHAGTPQPGHDANRGSGTQATPAVGRKRPPVVPGFVLGFLAAMVVRSVDVLPAAVLDAASVVQTALLAAAMFGMGAAIRLATILRRGGSGLAVGLLSTLLIAAVSYAGVALL